MLFFKIKSRHFFISATNRIYLNFFTFKNDKIVSILKSLLKSINSSLVRTIGVLRAFPNKHAYETGFEDKHFGHNI